MTLRLLPVVSLLVLAASALAPPNGRASSAPSIRLNRVSASSPYMHCKDRGAGHNLSNAQGQPQIAVDAHASHRRHPTLLAVWVQDPWSNGGARGLESAVSADGGRRWRSRPIPLGACAERQSHIARVSYPKLAIGPDGTAYLAVAGMTFAALSQALSASYLAPFDTLLVAASRNDGASWTHPRALPFNAENIGTVSLAAGPRGRGTAYVAWDSELGIWFSDTRNGGRSWSRPKVIVPGQPDVPGTAGGSIVVDPRTGAVDVIYDFIHSVKKARKYCGHDSGPRRCHAYKPPPGLAPWGTDLMIISSGNGGHTWSRPRRIARDLGVGWTGPRATAWHWTALHRPAAAVDPRSGKLSVVWQDSRFSIGRFDQVALSISDRSGRHWSTPVRVDQGNEPAVVPSIAVNARGVMGITYYQLRSLATNSRVPAADYWFRTATSPAHLAPPRRLAGPLDLHRTAMVFAPFMAHAEDIAPVGTTFHPIFVVPARKKKQTNVMAATVP